MKEIRSIVSAYNNIDHSKVRVALASVVNIEGSSYRRIGARMLVQSNGVWVGGISGGCLEGDALEKAQQAIYKNHCSVVTYDTLEDDQNQIGVGLGCNGKIDVLFSPIDPSDDSNEVLTLSGIIGAEQPKILIKIIEDNNQNNLGKIRLVSDELQDQFFDLDVGEFNNAIRNTFAQERSSVLEIGEKKILLEFIRPETRIILIGNNHDLSAMAGLCHQMGWYVTIVGRKRKVPKSLFSMAHHVMEYEDADKIECTKYTCVVLMTHDYNKDKALLPIFLEKKPAYLGMLGPRKRLEKLQSDLNINLSKIPFLYSPTGLDLGAESPEEIALSICSEIMAVMRDSDKSSLRERTSPIH